MCSHCAVYTKMIVRATDMLSSPSDPLLRTLTTLREYSTEPGPFASLWPGDEVDHASIQALYAKLYDKVTAGIDEVCQALGD